MFRIHHRKKARVASTRVTIADIDTGGHGDLSTAIPRPDDYVPVDHTAATVPVDRDVAVDQVVAMIGRLLDHDSLDDLTSDVLDAYVDARRSGWDVTVEREAPTRRWITLRLMAAELEGIAQVQQTLERLRVRRAELSDAVDRWRGELLGDAVLPRITPTASPMNLELDSHITQALAETRLASITYLQKKGA